MLHVPAPFPAVGSYGFIDDRTPDGRDVVERVRILQDKGQGQVLVSLVGRRFPREIASGNRTVPLSLIRETEHPAFPCRSSGRRPRAKAAAPKKAPRQ